MLEGAISFIISLEMVLVLHWCVMVAGFHFYSLWQPSLTSYVQHRRCGIGIRLLKVSPVLFIVWLFLEPCELPLHSTNWFLYLQASSLTNAFFAVQDDSYLQHLTDACHDAVRRLLGPLHALKYSRCTGLMFTCCVLPAIPSQSPLQVLAWGDS